MTYSWFEGVFHPRSSCGQLEVLFDDAHFSEKAQSSVSKPTKADAQNVVNIITSDKVKTQAYCDFNKLEGEVKAAAQKNEQAEALLDKLSPEYFKLMDGLEQVDPKSSEAKEFMSILSELDKSCTK